MKLPPPEPEAEGPNLTPVIDVVFLLLIFFLVATRFDQEERELNVILPEVVEAEPLSMPPQELIVNITRAGEYVVASQTIDEAGLAALLRKAALKNPGTQSVLIRGDGESPLRLGVRVMGLCNRAGITDYRVAAIEER
jgi:biopolymer transport protein ExbD